MRTAQASLTEHLGAFDGILQADGFSDHGALARPRRQIRPAFCWAHVRRKFLELASASPVASDVLRQITSLYAVEDTIRGHSPRSVVAAAASSSKIPAPLAQASDDRRHKK